MFRNQQPNWEKRKFHTKRFQNSQHQRAHKAQSTNHKQRKHAQHYRIVISILLLCVCGGDHNMLVIAKPSSPYHQLPHSRKHNRAPCLTSFRTQCRFIRADTIQHSTTLTHTTFKSICTICTIVHANLGLHIDSRNPFFLFRTAHHATYTHEIAHKSEYNKSARTPCECACTFAHAVCCTMNGYVYSIHINGPHHRSERSNKEPSTNSNTPNASVQKQVHTICTENASVDMNLCIGIVLHPKRTSNQTTTECTEWKKNAPKCNTQHDVGINPSQTMALARIRVSAYAACLHVRLSRLLLLAT